MEILISKITELFDLSYMGIVVFAVWFMLYYVFKNPTKWLKIGTSVTIGLVVGILFYITQGGKDILQQLLMSFFAAQVLYTWIIKALMEKFNITFNDNGVV